MRQIVYISTASRALAPAEVDRILTVSQANNRRDGITGLLYFDGRRFLQAIEGDGPMLDRVLMRIRADDRHRAVVLLSDRSVASREFGSWAMASRHSHDDAEAFLAQVSRLVATASPNVRGTFEGLAAARRAA
ncbi:BLUF domain-containing protein [Sphingomonas quercus]|uniref:BLUF domain-containing protein n=1 Tax=Sphingomonas quercus TaxID=2842451 RepID=A0ABS6BDE2_9SPHN|nr:BLUF domain-containing protein [Sphingomonas quercus]MBU3076336.1 BLUF domain-containing protein [Sphingomonas quercus]